MDINISKEITDYWQEFIKNHTNVEHLTGCPIDAWSFGNSPQMADELLALVLKGKKTATCSLLRSYDGSEDEIPRVGVYSIICDGKNHPKCVVFYTDTFVRRFDEVTEKHAIEEGDGSLENWRKIHRDFFSMYDNFSESDYLICERFTVVYK